MSSKQQQQTKRAATDKNGKQNSLKQITNN